MNKEIKLPTKYKIGDETKLGTITYIEFVSVEKDKIEIAYTNKKANKLYLDYSPFIPKGINVYRYGIYSTKQNKIICLSERNLINSCTK